MKKLIILSFCLLFIACNNSNENEVCDNCRTFVLDYSAEYLVLDVYGSGMGTPDALPIVEFLEERVTSGVIEELVQLEIATEGGGQYCILSSDEERRKELLDSLQEIQTNLVETVYKLASQATTCLP